MHPESDLNAKNDKNTNNSIQNSTQNNTKMSSMRKTYPNKRAYTSNKRRTPHKIPMLTMHKKTCSNLPKNATAHNTLHLQVQRQQL
jgi:hypothetical protein